MRPAGALAAGFLLVLLSLSGCGSPPPILHERTVILRAGPDGFAEVNVVLGLGQQMSWEWSSDGAAPYFNVHGHPSDGGSAQVFEQTTDEVESSGDFTAPASGTYSLLWENTGGTALTLTYKVTGEGNLDPMFPPTP